MKGAWSIVFISADPAEVVADALPRGAMTSVFLPCTPNPTTGFYFFVPTADIIELQMTPEDAAKLIMSAGLIQPEGQAALAAMAKAARPGSGDVGRHRPGRLSATSWGSGRPPPAGRRLNLCYL